jgi:hypothetical protein
MFVGIDYKYEKVSLNRHPFILPNEDEYPYISGGICAILAS